MNRVSLIGRLGNDIEVRATQNGKKFGYFSLAVRRSQDVTDWVRCRAWEKTVDILQTYTKKGSQIAVEGSIQTYKYKDQYGKTSEAMQVLADRIELLDKKEETRTTQVDVPQTFEELADQMEAKGVEYIQSHDDDLPF